MHRLRAVLVGILGGAVFVLPSYPFDGTSLYLSTLAVGSILSAVVAYLTVLGE